MIFTIKNNNLILELIPDLKIFGITYYDIASFYCLSKTEWDIVYQGVYRNTSKDFNTFLKEKPKVF